MYTENQVRQEYARMIKAQEKEYSGQMRQYEAYIRKQEVEEEKRRRFPKLTDKLIRECLTLEIYTMFTRRNMRVPQPNTLFSALKFRRVRARAPEPYTIKGKKYNLIKHACQKVGVSFNAPSLARIIYRNPNGVQYNHDYNLSVPFYFCPQCKAVIYYYEDIETIDQAY